MKHGLLTLLLGATLALPASADYLEVRRKAKIYAAPDRKSEILAVVAPGAEDETSILLIDREDPIERGYLQVRLPEGQGSGYVYRTAGRIYEDFEGRYEPYKRAAYKHWTDDDRDCENTRDEALIRDSVGVVKQTKVGSRCKVVSGQWLDPYTGTEFTDAVKLDVDHMVPLKNAHDSGAWAWSPTRKQEYANFLEDPLHLISASASENRKKGEKGPDRYLPPNAEYQCDYVQNWVRIKETWGLDIPPDEEDAVNQVLSGC